MEDFFQETNLNSNIDDVNNDHSVDNLIGNNGNDNDFMQSNKQNDISFSGNGPNNVGEHKNDNRAEEPTFLSVWQEQRRIELDKRAAKESEEQKKFVEEAIEELKQFNITRQRKIDAIKKENREKEKLLLEDLQATFKHGTIWEQVGKMVNLQEPKNTDNNSNPTERMRTVLIQLKNAKP